MYRAFEKLKFISIFTSNLDEFFLMIRVGKPVRPDVPVETADSIIRRGWMPPSSFRRFSVVRDRHLCIKSVIRFTERLRGFCARRGSLRSADGESYGRREKLCRKILHSRCAPGLVPAESRSAPLAFPHLVNKALDIVLQMKISDKTAYGIIPMPAMQDRLIFLPGSGMRYVLLEELIYQYAERVFDNCEINAKSIICVTRNADINVDSLPDEDEDFRHHMKKVLRKRSRLAPVRLENIAGRSMINWKNSSGASWN